MPTRRLILGLDPGLETTGYGLLDLTPAGPRVVEAGVIRSAAGRDPADMGDRVKSLYDGLLEVLDQWQPAAVAVEQLFAHVEHPRTAVLMAHARGVYFLAAAQRGIPVFSYGAAQVKKAVTGHGRAGKEQSSTPSCVNWGCTNRPSRTTWPTPWLSPCAMPSAAGPVLGGAKSATFTGVNMKALLGAPEDDPA